MLIAVKFVSIGNEDTKVISKAHYDTETNKVFLPEENKVEFDVLEQEYIELENGDILEVCQDCHNHVLVLFKNNKGQECLKCPNCD